MKGGTYESASLHFFAFAASGGRGSCFYSVARAYAARTCGYYCRTAKVTKNVPEPTVLDSLLGPADAATSAGDLRTLGGDEELRCPVNKSSFGHLIYALVFDQLRLTPC